MNQIQYKVGVIRPVECMKEGWELIKDQYWLIFAITFVGIIIASLIPLGIAIGAMFCGIYYVLFKKMNGERIEFGDLFKGFEYFLPGLIVTLVVIIPMIISMIFVYGSVIAMVFAATASGGQPNEAFIWALFGTIIVEVIIVSILAGCLHALIMFAYPLIIDFNLNGLEAFKLSAKAVWANLSGVAGIILVEFAMGFVGYLALGFGLYFVLPIMFAGVLVAYRKVFPDNKRFETPPPPNAFSGAGSYT